MTDDPLLADIDAWLAEYPTHAAAPGMRRMRDSVARGNEFREAWLKATPIMPKDATVTFKIVDGEENE